MIKTLPGIIVIPESDHDQMSNHQISIIGSMSSSLEDKNCFNLKKLGVRIFFREKVRWLGLFLSWHYHLDILGTSIIRNLLGETSLFLSSNQYSLHDVALREKNHFLSSYLGFLKDNAIVPRVLLPIDVYVLGLRALSQWIEEDEDFAVIHELGVKTQTILSMRPNGRSISCGFISIHPVQYDELKQVPDFYPLIVARERDVRELDELGLFDLQVHDELMRLLVKTLLKYQEQLSNLLNYGFLVEDVWKLVSYLEWLTFHPDSKNNR